ncbi:hypothetical protein V6R21_04375 [Limibacter armeniacum]|uniref:hypothetical protein n=1 Tax=Limibacter armeniacum TaxID=466084 RepID=UPI002FE55680
MEDDYRGGYHTGTGMIQIRSLNGVFFTVEYDDITINTDNQLIAGIVDVKGMDSNLIDPEIANAIMDGLDALDDVLDEAAKIAEFIDGVYDRLPDNVKSPYEQAQEDLEQAKNDLDNAKDALKEAKKLSDDDPNREAAIAAAEESVKQAKDAKSAAKQAKKNGVSQILSYAQQQTKEGIKHLVTFSTGVAKTLNESPGPLRERAAKTTMESGDEVLNFLYLIDGKQAPPSDLEAYQGMSQDETLAKVLELVDEGKEMIENGAPTSLPEGIELARKSVWVFNNAFGAVYANTANDEGEQQDGSGWAAIDRVTFQKHSGTEAGFDAGGREADKDYYTQVNLSGDEVYTIPWLAVAKDGKEKVVLTGATDGIRLQVTDKPEEVITSPDPSGTSLYTVKNKPTEWSVIRTVEGKDEILGKINVMAYKAETYKVYIIPVDGRTAPNATALETVLNQIYAQAHITWEVEVMQDLSGVVWDLNEDGKLQTGDSDILANYTEEQQALIKASRKDFKPRGKEVVLFWAPAASKEDVGGYMPMSRRHGFIYAPDNSEATWRAAAHELGHGVFHLEHIWEQFEDLAQGTTNNLMDYGNGTELWKWQWEQIHNPQPMVGFEKEDEESESEIRGLLISNENLRSLNISLDQYGFVSPDGKVIFLNNNSQFSFTGTTGSSELNSLIYKGALLAFTKDGLAYRATFKKVEGTWKFTGYLDKDDKPYMGASDVTVKGYNVIIGEENPDDCEVNIYTGQLNTSAYTHALDDKEYDAVNGSIAISNRKLSEESSYKIEYCHYKNVWVRNFVSKMIETQGADKEAEIKRVADVLDKLGKDWLDDYQPNSNSFTAAGRYIDTHISIYDKDLDGAQLTKIAKSLESFYAEKDTRLNSIMEEENADSLMHNICSYLTVNDYKKLTFAQRKHIITTLLSGDLSGGPYWFFGDIGGEEGVVVNTLTYFAGNQGQADALLELLSKDQDKKNILTGLNSKIDDGILFGLGGNNYMKLMRAIKIIIEKSSKYSTLITELNDNFDDRFLQFGEPSRMSEGTMFVDDADLSGYSINFTQKVFKGYELYTSRTGDGIETKYRKSYSYLKDTLNAFDLVLFVNASSLGEIDEATQVQKGQFAIVPAIFLEYSDQKDFNQNCFTAAEITLDVASLAVSGGTLTLAKNLTKFKKIWLIYEIVNSGFSVAVNLGDLANDPEIGPAVTYFQLFLSIGDMGDMAVEGARGIKNVRKSIDALSTEAQTAALKCFDALKKVNVNNLSENAKNGYEKMLSRLLESGRWNKFPKANENILDALLNFYASKYNVSLDDLKGLKNKFPSEEALSKAMAKWGAYLAVSEYKVGALALMKALPADKFDEVFDAIKALPDGIKVKTSSNSAEVPLKEAFFRDLARSRVDIDNLLKDNLGKVNEKIIQVWAELAKGNHPLYRINFSWLEELAGGDIKDVLTKVAEYNKILEELRRLGCDECVELARKRSNIRNNLLKLLDADPTTPEIQREAEKLMNALKEGGYPEKPAGQSWREYFEKFKDTPNFNAFEAHHLLAVNMLVKCEGLREYIKLGGQLDFNAKEGFENVLMLEKFTNGRGVHTSHDDYEKALSAYLNSIWGTIKASPISDAQKTAKMQAEIKKLTHALKQELMEQSVKGTKNVNDLFGKPQKTEDRIKAVQEMIDRNSI